VLPQRAAKEPVVCTADRERHHFEEDVPGAGAVAAAAAAAAARDWHLTGQIHMWAFGGRLGNHTSQWRRCPDCMTMPGESVSREAQRRS